MANIIVAGDSWSISQVTTNCDWWLHSYPAQLSVANRLRSHGHFVFESASGGSSMLRQLYMLEQLFSCPYDNMYASVNYVVLGWTEWTRDTELFEAGQSAALMNTPPMKKSYLSERDRVYDELQLRFREFSDTWPGVQFLHWGGQAPVSIDMTKLGDHHHILYKDYALEVWDAAPNLSHLYSFAPRSASIRECTKWVQRVFPGTSKELANTIAVEQNSRYRSLLLHKSFQDGGHLNFHCYSPLIDRINAHLDGTAPPANTYNKFIWPE